MTPAHQIAEKLTEAQARIILLWGTAAHSYHWSVANLIGKGLLTYRRRWWLIGEKGVHLTRLGLAVRAHLLSKESEQ